MEHKAKSPKSGDRYCSRATRENYVVVDDSDKSYVTVKSCSHDVVVREREDAEYVAPSIKILRTAFARRYREMSK